MAQALARLAEDAVTLLCTPDVATLARCPAEGRVRLLLRTHGRRHWCSIRCGDRVPPRRPVLPPASRLVSFG
jgi:predicted RNA-binding Zn ribbon-like protein